MTPSEIAHSKPVRTAAQWANLVAFTVVMLGLALLGELALTQIIGLVRSPEDGSGAGELFHRLLPWLISLAAIVAAGGLAIWSAVKHHRPRAWALAGAAYLVPFLALTLRF